MIIAAFEKNGKFFSGVSVSGHADFANYGEDIVCSAVTSALELCANGITEILEEDATVIVEENRVDLLLPEEPSPSAQAFLAALHLHLTTIRDDYPMNITINTTEV